MRIKEKAFASCAKMSDESVMNGDAQGCLKLKSEQEFDPDRTKCTKSPSSMPDFETFSLAETRLKCFKGSGFGSNVNVKESERDDNSNPSSPYLISNEGETNSVGGGGSSIYGGGRLKFFKDGKFILELSHRKDGEKMCWIPVPKKTYWPAVGTPRQESSTSLSVSDDNSSVQSSPWQRDHCWKQAIPRQNINQELEFSLCRPACMRKLRYTSKAVRAKRRKPSDPSIVDKKFLEKVCVKVRRKVSLDGVVQQLWERILNTCKSEPGIVSPRKRILRELERVTLEEASKRQRARPPTRTISSHSISAILAREDESVLRTLLRSPSPSLDNTRSQARLPSPFLPSSSHSIHTSYSSSTPFYAQVPTSYRAPNSLWPVHYPVSSPSVPLPLYPVPPYHSSPWSHVHRHLTQETSPELEVDISPGFLRHLWPKKELHSFLEETKSDMPLNLSKNSG